MFKTFFKKLFKATKDGEKEKIDWNRKMSDPAVKVLQGDITNALLADSCVIFTSQLIKHESGEDELMHTMFYGAGFKHDDLKISLDAYHGLIESEISKKQELPVYEAENAKVVSNATIEAKRVS